MANANYFIFRCSNKTHAECLRRHLFGQTSKLKTYVSNVKKGDILFLHNTQTQIIEGPFFAKSDGKTNIVSDAWNGDFPEQVEVETHGQISKIKKESFEKFGLRYAALDRFLDFKIRNDIGRKLLEALGLEIDFVKGRIADYNVLDDSDIDIRLKYIAEYRCKDGHYVRSKNEVIIDNWLYEKELLHAYESKIPGEKMLSDFCLKNKFGEKVYIEVWGLDSSEYKNRKKIKLDIYRKNNLKVISIEEKHIKNIDDYLSDILLKYNIL